MIEYLFSAVFVLLDPTVFTVLLVLISVSMPIVYFLTDNGLLGGFSASSLILMVISPLFFLVYKVTLVEYLLLFIVFSVPFLLDFFLTVMRKHIEGNEEIRRYVHGLVYEIQQLDDRVESIESNLQEINLQRNKEEFT